MTQPTVSQHWRTMVSQPRQGGGNVNEQTCIRHFKPSYKRVLRFWTRLRWRRDWWQADETVWTSTLNLKFTSQLRHTDALNTIIIRWLTTLKLWGCYNLKQHSFINIKTKFSKYCAHFYVIFLSASLYFSKRGAYWDRLCRDVVGRWLVGCHARALWPNGAS